MSDAPVAHDGLTSAKSRLISPASASGRKLPGRPASGLRHHNKAVQHGGVPFPRLAAACRWGTTTSESTFFFRNLIPSSRWSYLFFPSKVWLVTTPTVRIPSLCAFARIEHSREVPPPCGPEKTMSEPRELGQSAIFSSTCWAISEWLRNQPLRTVADLEFCSALDPDRAACPY
jgi:hypothetical protein